MRKLAKITAGILLMMLLCGALAACDDAYTPVSETLPSPIAVASGSTVSWNAVEDAVSYAVYVDGVLETTVTSTYYVAESSGEHSVFVIAKGSGKEDSPRSNIVKCTGAGSQAVREDVFYNFILADGAWDYTGSIDEAINFVKEKQSKDETLWQTFEDVFVSHLDNDGGYRGEYWGKTLRGAVLAYRYSPDEELYEIMENTVRTVMSAQEDSGRIAGMDADKEFGGWDIWGRSYVIIGMLHFYSVCRDTELKADILDSCRRQLDYIMEYVGDGSDGRLNILDTTSDWQGLPSARIIQAALAVYSLTGERKYLDYAKLIIDTDGCKMLSSEGRTVVEDCLAMTPMYEWGCRKFYEVTNFFDGIFMYYMLTGDEEAKRIALNYYELVKASEITETGAIATDVEEANNASVEQADPTNLGRMQENCALAVWIKYCAKIYLVFDRIDALDCIEKAYYNVILGTIDYDFHNGFPFFSYSPCGCTARTDVYSGGAWVKDRFYSCCIAMGNAALGLVPQLSVTTYEKGISANMYFDGIVEAVTPSGEAVTLDIATNMPSDGNVKITLGLAEKEQFALRVRVPEWSGHTTVKINGEAIKGAESGSYCVLDRTWQSGDVIEIELDMTAHLIRGSEECSNTNARYNVVVKRGPLVFARDYRIEGDAMFSPVSFKTDGDVLTDVELTEVNFRHQAALRIATSDGYITLVDYGSAGKTMDDRSIMCLWIPTVDYWSANLDVDVVVRCFADGSPNYWKDGKLYTAQSYKGTTDKEILSAFAWRFLPTDRDGVYRIYDVGSGKYLTVADNGYTVTADAEERDDGSQFFTLKTVGLNRYKIVGMYGKLLTVHDQTLETYMFNDISHDLQYWYIEEL